MQLFVDHYSSKPNKQLIESNKNTPGSSRDRELKWSYIEACVLDLRLVILNTTHWRA